MNNYTVERAVAEDLDAIMSIFSSARAYMASLGNPQWQDGFPQREFIEGRIRNKVMYKIMCGGDIAAVFSMLEADSDYDKIDGKCFGSPLPGVGKRKSGETQNQQESAGNPFSQRNPARYRRSGIHQTGFFQPAQCGLHNRIRRCAGPARILFFFRRILCPWLCPPGVFPHFLLQQIFRNGHAPYRRPAFYAGEEVERNAQRQDFILVHSEETVKVLSAFVFFPHYKISPSIPSKWRRRIFFARKIWERTVFSGIPAVSAISL